MYTFALYATGGAVLCSMNFSLPLSHYYYIIEYYDGVCREPERPHYTYRTYWGGDGASEEVAYMQSE